MSHRLLFLLLSISIFFAAVASAENRVLEGLVLTSIVDYQNGSVEKIYHLKIANSYQGFRVSKETKVSSFALISGAKIRVTGTLAADGIIEAETVEFLKPAPTLASNGVIGGLASTGTRNAVIIIVHFEDATVNCTASEIDGYMYTDTQSALGIFETSSRNQLTFTRDTNGDGAADIFGPFTIARSSGSCATHHGWGMAAFNAAEAAGVDFSPYQHRVFVLPSVCGFGGVAGLACGDECSTYILTCNDSLTWAHELGHNFGLDHAGDDEDNDGIIESTYGDTSCPMGFTSNKILFNAPHTVQLGWLDSFSGKVVTVSSSSSLNILPLEASSSIGTEPQVVKVQKASGDYYYLSYRTNLGTYDEIGSEFLNKLSVHRKTDTEQTSRFIKALGQGESFVDSELGLTVCHNSRNSAALNATVAFSGSYNCEGVGEVGDADDTGLPSGDSDGDGVTDSQEVADGTNASDPGSYLVALSSPVYTLWNSFLGMTNILELITPDSNTSSLATTQATVSLYSIEGTHIYSQQLTLSAGEQYDMILNSIPGFLTDSYGIVKITYTGNLEGRMSYYKTAADATSYEFAYSVPLSTSLRGTTSVGFNTYQPSTSASESLDTVFNWLTIVNIANTAKSFTIKSYDQAGTLLDTRTESIPGFGRIDIDGGHAFVGPSVVGLHEIIPGDLEAPYLSQVIRYGSDASPGSAVSRYNFAFPLAAHAGNGEVQYLPLSRQFGETTWVEVVNTRNNSVSVQLDFYDESGDTTTVSTSLPPHAQAHFEANDSRLPSGERGYVEITPGESNAVISQSMFYYRNSAGSIDAMAGISSYEALGTQYNGSYNLFLGMQNWLSLSNITSSSVAVTINTTGAGSSGSQAVTIPANSTTAIAIHGNTDLNTSADTYGFVQVVPDRPRSLVVDLHRVRYLEDTVDFSFPTAVRAQ